MARVKIEDIVDHLSSDIRRALRDALGRTAPECEVDSRQLFRAFKRAIGRRCSTWDRVPDRYIDVD